MNHMHRLCTEMQKPAREVTPPGFFIVAARQTDVVDNIVGTDNHTTMINVPGIDKLRLLIVWIRDVFDEDDLSYLLGADDARLQDEAATWIPSLSDEQKDSLQWLAGEMVKDREMNDWMLSMIRRLGFNRGTL